jgi:hypothetical protein
MIGDGEGCVRWQKTLSAACENKKWVYLYPFNLIKMGTFLGGDPDVVGIMMHMDGETNALS